MENIFRKNIASGIEDVDATGRTVVFYASRFGNIDLDRDMMRQGSYKKSITERGPGGTNEIFHLSNHRPQPEYVLGKPSKLEEDNYGLKSYSNIRNTTHGDDILKGYQDGIFNQHSVMFSVTKGNWEVKVDAEEQQYTEIYQAKLYEVSTVLWGANPDTPVVELKNYFREVYENDISKAFEQLEKLNKSFRKGTYTDEFFGLLEIEIKSLKTILSEEIKLLSENQKSIETAAKASQPLDNKGEELYKLILASI